MEHHEPGFMGEMDRPGMGSEVPDDLLKYYIKSFIDAASNQQTFRPAVLPELGLSMEDKMKIRGRTEVLAKHLFANQSEQILSRELGAFLHPIDTQASGPFIQGNRFADNSQDWANEFEHMGPAHHQPNHFEQIWEQNVATDNMAREFEQHNREADFENIFRQSEQQQRWVDEFEGKMPVERLDNIKDVTRSLTELQDPKLQSTNFMKFMSGLHKGELEITEDSVISKTPADIGDDWAQEFESQRPQTWEEEFSNRLEQDDLYGNVDDWIEEFQEDRYNDAWAEQFTRGGPSTATIVRDYEFSDLSRNPYLGMPDAFEIGMRLFNEGKISESILAFEAEIQNDPENSECWEKLGQAHAENDKDTQAIAALNRAVDLDETNLEAKMSLAVSYTNDLYRDHALDTLRAWMDCHPDYNAISRNYPRDIAEEDLTFSQRHERVVDLFLEAARMNLDAPDPEVQVAIGLLFNLSMDYDKAVDCFKTALSVKSQDYLLWNKLGATLANSSRSDEAIGCYYRALEAKPSFVRARANLGISYMALRQYEKAAQYFLGAISMHPEARHIWTNLQMVFMSMDRDDLVDKTAANDVEVFRNDFEF